MPIPPPKPTLWTATLTCPPSHADAIADRFADTAVSVSVLSVPRQELAKIEANFTEEPDAAALNAEMGILGLYMGIKIGTVQVARVADLDWLKKVAADFPPITLGRWIVYGAAHKQAVPAHKRLALQIDATSAFGTGEHPTTRGCLILLDEVLKKESPQSLLDMGCGSGILAMAYAKAQHGQAVAVDMDPLSVIIARENARQNGLDAFVHVGYSCGTASTLVQSGAPYDLVMANIFARPLCEMATDLKKLMLPGGLAILSGILNTQANGVISVYRALGFSLIRRKRLGEWSALALRYPKGSL